MAVDGKPLPKAERTRLFLYHKPRGLVTTHADPEGRPTIFGKLPKDLPRLISVGRLDLSTEGLLLLTNDGGLARVLELPETGWLRRYRVRAHGSVTQAQLDALRKGVTVDGVRYGEIEATLDRHQGANVWLTFAIREGKNREVRNVLEHLGLRVNRLIRVSFGPFQLGDLPEGERRGNPHAAFARTTRRAHRIGRRRGFHRTDRAASQGRSEDEVPKTIASEASSREPEMRKRASKDDRPQTGRHRPKSAPRSKDEHRRPARSDARPAKDDRKKNRGARGKERDSFAEERPLQARAR